MSNLPSVSPDAPHPEWCDPEYCELLQPEQFSDHRSTPILIESATAFPERVTVWLGQFAFEEPASAPIYVNLRFEEASPNGELDRVSTHSLRLDRAAMLAGALAALANRGAAAQRGVVR